MRWDVERWVKLYVRSDPKWLRLDLSARGLAAELLKIVDIETGLIEIGDEEPAQAIARLCCAKPHEFDRVKKDVASLFTDGFLKKHREGVFIPNVPEAQRRHDTSTARVRRHRAHRQSGTPGNAEGNADGTA